MTNVITMAPRKSIALVAHDSRKGELGEWAQVHRATLARHSLYATRSTGALIAKLGLDVRILLSGPLGGDQQIGALIAEGKLDALIFFWDPLAAHAHEADVRALLRIATLWNIPQASNRATADFLVSSPLLDTTYPRALHARANDAHRAHVQ